MTFHVKQSGCAWPGIPAALEKEWPLAVAEARADPSPRNVARVAILANMRRQLALAAERELAELRNDARRRAPSDDEDDNPESRLHRTLLDEDE